jgi:hypothetical protein
MKSPKSLIVLAVLGTALSLRADDDLELEQCPANVQETIRANTRDGKVDEVNAITIDDRTLYLAEIDLPGRNDDLKVFVGSDGKLIKTHEQIALAETPSAVLATAENLVPDGGRLDDIDKEVADGKVTYSVEIDRPKAADLDVLIAEDGTLVSQTEDSED